MPITREEFRHALGKFTSGVTVVTTCAADGHPHGLTVSAFCSVSLEPPLILVCIEKTTGSYHAFEESKAFVVNILSESQSRLSNHFASYIEDKFAGIEYETGIENIPVLKDCLVNLECRLANSYDGGDHTIFVGEIEKARIADGNPLAYFHGNYRRIIE